MRRALELAKQARAEGEVPIGALVVLKDEIVGEGWNRPISTNDPTAHAEIVAMRAAAQNLSTYRLLDTILYVTLEPCAMCAAAIYWSGISQIVYGCAAQTLENMAHGGFVIPSNQLFKHGERKVIAMGPYFENEAVKVHEGFWK